MAPKVRRGDRVAVLTGKDAGKQGRVIAVFPGRNTVLVEGVNTVKRHEKIRPAQGRSGQEGGIIHKDLPIHLSNVALVCGNCGPTRAGFRMDEGGGKTRICRNCEAEV